tara:strand:+ start:48 stop:269 length:222 start_codon:yes stop_codon:yes gene_type:complete
MIDSPITSTAYSMALKLVTLAQLEDSEFMDALWDTLDTHKGVQDAVGVYLSCESSYVMTALHKVNASLVELVS